MGAGQSSNTHESGPAGRLSGTESKTCYYELLDLQVTATDDEIKKAYRKKALELHPDRNYGNVEATTVQFAELQSAYEVLSDPQERAWYDSHRSAILKGGDTDGKDDRERNMHTITAQDILGFFGRLHGRLDYSDSSTGFFAALRTTFESLAHEEETSCEWQRLPAPVYPTFGSSEDEYQTRVKPFYSAWANFATKKSFAWRDAYRYSDAPDRRIRRLMEKDNNRRRDEGIREFNDAVRSLVAFVRKRDPRVPLTQESEADRQKILQEAAASQAARSRAANQAKLGSLEELPAWMRSSEPPETEISDDEKVGEAQEEIECAVCRKSFKSEKQYQSHARSKKHQKAVREIQRDMYRDAKNLTLDQELDEGYQQSAMSAITLKCVNAATLSAPDPSLPIEAEVEGFESDQKGCSIQETSSQEATDALSSSSDQDESSVHEDGSRLHNASEDSTSSHVNSQEVRVISKTLSDVDLNQIPKKGKAKEKRAKKAARLASERGEAGLTMHLCRYCNAKFPSKTKLFGHLEETGHASVFHGKDRGWRRK